MAKSKKPQPKPYADTTVSVQKSRADVDKVLSKHGVRAVQWTTIDHASVLRFQFEYEGSSYFVRMVVDPRKQGDSWVRGRSKLTEDRHFERESMRLHRVLFFAVKSKLEVIESGLDTPFNVWLPQIEAGSDTVAERVYAHAESLSAPALSMKKVLALNP